MSEEERVIQGQPRLQFPAVGAVAIDRPMVDITTSSHKVDVRDLTVRYGTFVALREITLTVPQNSVFAIIGPSGSGKSTLLRALNRMHDTIPSAQVEG
ncbi:MAG: ATP-binding cassette domain-containing protein, partial [Thermomicrobiales bacterium]|nr:ATP-binding cassette domain-containing protein [Thermomicrobiales bacterium]